MKNSLLKGKNHMNLRTMVNLFFVLVFIRSEVSAMQMLRTARAQVPKCINQCTLNLAILKNMAQKMKLLPGINNATLISKRMLMSTPIIASASQINVPVKPMCYSCISFENHPQAIAKTKHFKAVLDGRDQKTPGRLFLETQEHISSLTEWTDEMWVEFGKFSRALQLALKKAFNPDEPNKLVNVACLMNLAREEGTHTHWHLMPRYRNSITLIDPETNKPMTFTDEFYGKPYDFNPKNYRQLSPAFEKMIIQKILDNLDLSDIQGAEKKSSK